MRVVPTQDLDVMPHTVQRWDYSYMTNVVLASPEQPGVILGFSLS